MANASRRADAPPPRVRYERSAGAASAPLPAGYRRREPEKTVLHAIVRDHLETFLEEPRRHDGDGYPAFLEREFRRYLRCGLLAPGFARLRCPECGFERLLAFSCKGRLCPSCLGRRMADSAAYLVDDLLPVAAYRQWVLTFPWTLRYRLAVDRALFAKLLGVFLRTVFAWQRRRGRTLGIRDGQTGSVTFVQRFGGALNLNPHLHSLLPDGLFVPAEQGDEPLTFVPLPEPTAADIEGLTRKIAARLTAVVERLCADQCDTDAVLERTAAAIRQALAAAVELPLPKLGLELLGLDHTTTSAPLCAKVAGFSLHAARVVPAEDREALEKLCRYGLRAPFSQERLRQRSDGRVVYDLRRSWPNADGAHCLVLDPVDLLRRLAALVPAPDSNLVRYHGIFASRSHWRARWPVPPRNNTGAVVEPAAPLDNRLEAATGHPSEPASHTPPPDSPTRTRRRSLPWAQLLRRVLLLDALTCPRCATPMVLLALISDPLVVRKILLHLGLPADIPPTAPARQTPDAFFDDDLQSDAPARSPP